MKFQRTLAAVVICLVVGCSVVDKEQTQGTYDMLGRWKTAAENARKDERLAETTYLDLRTAVNRWIDTKKAEVTIAGGEWFGSVDTSVPAELRQEVEKALPPGIATLSIPAWIIELLEWWLKLYKEGRTKQAAGTVVAFDGLKWAE